MKLFTKLFAAINPNNQPINPPAASGSQVVYFGGSPKTTKTSSFVTGSADEDWRGMMDDHRKMQDDYIYNQSYSWMPGNVFHHND